MALRYHRSVARDVANAIKRYGEDGGLYVERRFLEELESALARIEASPEMHHFDRCGWRRCNLIKFPYHFLFVVDPDATRVMVLHHHRQHPTFGIRRR